MYHISFIMNTSTNIADNGYLVLEFYDWFPHDSTTSSTY